ncbi:MAG: sulfotransferase, partial [Deltaproteobacteria bacterium]|nr:sulfotransferase [Deltaproteobacteria bacterium]
STSPLSDRLLRASVRGGLFELVRNTILGLLPGSRRCLQGILERNQQLIEIVCKLQGGRVFLDGSKDPIRLRHLHLADRWNIKVLYLIRDGRGAANSYMRHYHVPMATAAREWRLTHRECDRVIGELSDDTYIRVHYEDLCAKPRATLGSIYAFLGLEPDLDDVRLSVLQQHILGNEMRLRSVEEIKLDEKWKSVLAPEDIRVFERVAGRYNHALRYG